MSGIQALPSKTQSSLSTEPVYIAVSAQVPGSASPENVSGDTVKFAFKPPGEKPNTPPSGSDWTAGSILTETNGAVTIYLAQISVGPAGAVTLPNGVYVVWVWLNDTLGTPVAQVGTLTIADL